MTQANPIIGADKSGLQYRTEDNDGKRALLNHHKGSTAPTYAEAGMLWLDDTATPWLMKLYDGTDWITLGEFNATTNNFAPYVAGSVVGSASETAQGLIELATQAEVDAGTDTTRAVTPATLANTPIGGKVLGQAYTSTSAVFTTTSTIPNDDTIPQNTEGAELLTLSYTPQSSTSKIVIEAGALTSDTSNNTVILALFMDTNVDAIATTAEFMTGGTYSNPTILYEETSSSTTARTYKLRIGGIGGTTLNVNGQGGARRFGGTAQTYIKITEIEV